MKAANRSISGPDIPRALRIDKAADTSVVAEIANFKKGNCLDGTTPTLTSPCPQSGEDERNTIIYDLKLIIDQNFEEYGKNYEQVADTTTFAGEVSAASLSGVATIVGDAGEKAVLALASTLTQSTLTSAQKNFYQKQTAYAILSVMDSQRLDKWKDILQSMKQKLADYPLSAALADLAEYRRRGTAVAALASIQQSAGATQVQATASIDATKGINQPQTQLSVTTNSLPAGAVNSAYSVTLKAAGGLSPYTWAVTTGSLPAGLSLNSSTGTISGTPTAAGAPSFTITVTDSEKPTAKATAILSIAVN